MCKNSVIARNNKNLKLFNKFKQKRALLKKSIKNRNITLSERMNFIRKLALLPRGSSKTRYTNRCLITGRARGLRFYKEFPFSRIKIRELALQGMLPGVTKSSW